MGCSLSLLIQYGMHLVLGRGLSSLACCLDRVRQALPAVARRAGHRCLQDFPLENGREESQEELVCYLVAGVVLESMRMSEVAGKATCRLRRQQETLGPERR